MKCDIMFGKGADQGLCGPRATCCTGQCGSAVLKQHQQLVFRLTDHIFVSSSKNVNVCLNFLVLPRFSNSQFKLKKPFIEVNVTVLMFSCNDNNLCKINGCSLKEAVACSLSLCLCQLIGEGSDMSKNAGN